MKIHLTLKYLPGIFVICLVFVFGLVFVESQAHPVEKLLDDIVYDNRNHYLSCDQLPTVAEVESVVEKQEDIIKQIEQVDSPGYVEVSVDDFNCPGKADILITYPSHSDRIKIEQIINSDTFFGIPYRLLNV